MSIALSFQMISTSSTLFIALFCWTLATTQAWNNQSVNPIVRASNMTKSMQVDAIRISKEAFEKFHGYSKNSRSSITQYIRSKLDHQHGPSWQCIIGLDYALSITSENERRIIVDIGKVSILIFKGKC